MWERSVSFLACKRKPNLNRSCFVGIKLLLQWNLTRQCSSWYGYHRALPDNKTSTIGRKRYSTKNHFNWIVCHGFYHPMALICLIFNYMVCSCLCIVFRFLLFLHYDQFLSSWNLPWCILVQSKKYNSSICYLGLFVLSAQFKGTTFFSVIIRFGTLHSRVCLLLFFYKVSHFVLFLSLLSSGRLNLKLKNLITHKNFKILSISLYSFKIRIFLCSC